MSSSALMTSTMHSEIPSAELKKKELGERIRSAVEHLIQKKRNARKRVEHWLQSSNGGFVLDAVNTVLSILSCILYVFETYNKPLSYGDENVQDLMWNIKSNPADIADLAITSFFLLDFLVNLYAAESRPAYLKKSSTLIDIVTILPPVVSFIIMSQVSEMGAGEQDVVFMRIITNLSFLRFVRVFRVLRLIRINRQLTDSRASDVSRQIFKVTFSLLSIAFIFAGLFYTCETVMVSPADMQDTWNPPLSRWPLRVDRNAETGEPEYRLLYHDAFYYTIITMSTVGYGDFYPISIPGKFLVSLMLAVTFAIISKQTNKLLQLMGLQSIYARQRYFKTNAPHVIVCGNIASNSARDFLQEFFHPDHGRDDSKLIILSPHTPDAAMEYLLRSPEYETNTVYLEGSAMNELDLLRCETCDCEYVFVLANKFCTDPGAEDAATALRAISIKKHVAQNAKGKNIPVILQLIRPENKHNFTSSVYGRKEMSNIICMDEIKLHLLAKTALCPGFSTMISNLIKSCAEEASESNPTWLQEYVGGVGQEIYRTKLSQRFNGMTFSQAATYIYKNFQSTMFAVEVTDIDLEADATTLGVSRSQSRGDLEKSSSKSGIKKSASISSLLRNFKLVGTGKRSSLKQLSKKVLLNPSGFIIGSESETYVFVLADDQGAADKLTFAEVLIESGAPQPLKKSMSTLSVRSQGVSSPLSGAGGHTATVAENELLEKDINSHWQKRTAKLRLSYHIVDKAVQLNDATYDSLDDMTGHIMLCGSTSALFYFAATLRSKSTPLHRLKHLVILHPHMPDKAWEEICYFPNIFFVQGSALEPLDLARAGVRGLARAVVLSHASAAGASTEATDYLVDADAIFAFQAIRRVNPQAMVVSEVINSDNITFLSPEGGVIQNADPDLNSPQFMCPFAAGHVYVNSVLDMLACQAYYNPYLVNILRELVVSGGTSSINTIAGEQRSCDLEMIDVPKDMHGKAYSELYESLCNRGMLSLGLYRKPDARSENKLCYVVTNPPPDMIVNRADLVYVLTRPLQEDGYTFHKGSNKYDSLSSQSRKNSISVYTGKGRRKSDISITPLESQLSVPEGNTMLGEEQSHGLGTGESRLDRPQQQAPENNKGADVADDAHDDDDDDDDDMRVTDRTTAGETAEIIQADGTGSTVRSMSLEDMEPLPSESLEVWRHSLSKTGKNPNPRALAPLPPMKTAPGAAGLMSLPRDLKQQTNQEKILVLRQEIQKLRGKLIMKGEQVARDNAEMSEYLALLETRAALGMEEEEALSERLMGA